MTFFAKWRTDETLPNISVGGCARADIALQSDGDPNVRVAVMGEYHSLDDLEVGPDGLLRRKGGAVVEVEHLTDDMLFDLLQAVQAQGNSDRVVDAFHRMLGAQTLSEAHAALARNDLVITPDDLAHARRERGAL